MSEPTGASAAELRRELTAAFARQVPAQRRNILNRLALDPTDAAGVQAYAAGYRGLATEGWLGLGTPPEYGGRGGDSRQRLLLAETSARAGIPIAGPTLDLAVPLLQAIGSRAQRQLFLPPLLDGTARVAIATQVTAALDSERHSDGPRRLTGQCLAIADYGTPELLIIATPGTPSGTPVLCLLTLDSPGVSLTPMPGPSPVSLHRVRLESVVLPEPAILPFERVQTERLNVLRGLTSAYSCAVHLDMLVSQVARWAGRARTASGPRIIEQEWVRATLGRTLAQVDGLRAFIEEDANQAPGAAATTPGWERLVERISVEVPAALAEVLGPEAAIAAGSPRALLGGEFARLSARAGAAALLAVAEQSVLATVSPPDPAAQHGTPVSTEDPTPPPSGLGIPESLGGRGGSLSQWCESVMNAAHLTDPSDLVHSAAARVLAEHANVVLQHEWLPGAATGALRLTAAIVEEHGVATDRPATMATARPDGFRLTGTKVTVPGIAEADAVLVPAFTSDGTALFLVRSDDLGVARSKAVLVDGAAAGSLELDAVPVAAERLVGTTSGAACARLVDVITLGSCAELVGILRSADARTHLQHSATPPPLSPQAQLLQSAVRRAARVLDSGRPAARELRVAAYWACRCAALVTPEPGSPTLARARRVAADLGGVTRQELLLSSTIRPNQQSR